MPEGSDRIFISIGVSKPHGGLAELPGAITASERMAAWARAQGYKTLLIHDASLPEITTDLLRDRIVAAIEEVTSTTELKRLVFFFAGHGAALAIGDQYWILTNWKTRPTEAIKVSSLQRMLEYYGPKQVSVIGDACQEFSSNFIELLGSAVLDRPDEEPQAYELDQFFAVGVGKQAFMIKAIENNNDFCLFTEVLLDALNGDAGEACFEKIDQYEVVTSQSLARYLKINVPLEAGKFGLRMDPHPKPGFYTDRVYFTKPVDAVCFIEETEDKPTTYSNGRGKVRLEIPILKKQLLEIQATHFDNIYIDKFGKNIFSMPQVHYYFETRCGICVSGANVNKVEASFGSSSRLDENQNCFRIHLQSGNNDRRGWSDTLVTLEDGRIVSVCAVNNFIATLHIIDAASLILFYKRLDTDIFDDNESISLLNKLHANLLTPVEIINTASRLRKRKHKNISLGCIVAQFYDVIRDVDSLRSIAAFYAMNLQPVPLDIILFGGGTISEDKGQLYANIPRVKKRLPRTQGEIETAFTIKATPEIEKHPIAGRIPWMRQAWGAVETASFDKSGLAWRELALSAMKFLAPGTFTIIKPEGREAIVELAGIIDEKNKPEQFLAMY